MWYEWIESWRYIFYKNVVLGLLENRWCEVLFLFYVFGIFNDKKIGLFLIGYGVNGYCCGFRKVGVDFDVFLMYKVYN